MAYLFYQCILITSLLVLPQVDSIKEIYPSFAAVAQPTAACKATMYARPCKRTDGTPISNYPDGYPCPCPKGPGGVGLATGSLPTNDTNLGNFVDEVLVGSGPAGFTNLIAMAFTDNTNELFVTTKPGQVYRVDLTTKEKTLWIDLVNEIHSAGDKGLIGIETHSNFASNPFVFLSYTVDPDLVEPDGPSSAIVWHRVIRVKSVDKKADVASRVILYGATAADSAPSCSTTHEGGGIALGLDGTLFLTTGEGAHYEWADFGQDVTAVDPGCRAMFGIDQDIGALRSQSYDSLGGKLLRINPDNGDGICSGSGYEVLNPYCDSNPHSIRSRIWALGLRNPDVVNVRPRIDGEDTRGPGVVYIGDVGQGSYEEINVVTTPGMNFGWPCWEGPLPMDSYRDSAFNTNPTIPYHTINGARLNCPYVYNNVTTNMPFYYWTRAEEGGGSGTANTYLGQGFLGNCVGGVGFYSGNSYPPSYKNSVWVMDFGRKWIKVIKKTANDKFQSIQHFGSYGAVIFALETNPNTGNICYLTQFGNQVRTIRYTASNTPPEVLFTVDKVTGKAPLTVQFSMDGTNDRENQILNYQWNFGDGSTSTEANPRYVFTKEGTFQVTLSVTDAQGAKASRTQAIYVNGNVAPVVSISQPVANDGFYDYSPGEMVQFAATATDENPSSLSYKWEIQLVHNNHIHPDAYTATTPSFTASVADIGDASHAGDRITFRVNLRVTDVNGSSGQATIYLRAKNWLTIYGNKDPIPAFSIGNSPYSVGQPISFDASDTKDDDLDYLFLNWSFGDGAERDGLKTTHIYENPGTYTVSLTAMDNFGSRKTISKILSISNGAQSSTSITHSTAITSSTTDTPSSTSNTRTTVPTSVTSSTTITSSTTDDPTAPITSSSSVQDSVSLSQVENTSENFTTTFSKDTTATFDDITSDDTTNFETLDEETKNEEQNSSASSIIKSSLLLFILNGIFQ